MSVIKFLTSSPCPEKSTEQKLADAYALMAKMETHLACPTCYAPAYVVRNQQGEPVKFHCPTCIWEEEI